MSYNVLTIPPFDRQLKRLIKKYPSLKVEIRDLGDLLAQNPTYGTPLQNSCFKIRISIKSKGRGKSGGARIITHTRVTKNEVFLLSIYDKSEKVNITDSEPNYFLDQIN